MKRKLIFSKLVIMIGTIFVIIGFVYFSFNHVFFAANDKDISTGKTDMTNSSAVTCNGSTALSVSECKKIQNEVSKISTLYMDIHKAAKREGAPDWDYDSDYAIDRKSLDRIEDTLIKKGYPVINSNENDPEYLENVDGFYEFWKSAEEDKEGKVVFWNVTSSGDLFYKSLQFVDGKATYDVALAKWSEKQELKLDYALSWPVYNWGMTSKGDFYYQELPLDWHWDATTLLRLNPVDEELYNYNKTYIEPIGYQGTNLFLSEWNEGDYSNLCPNDLFEQFYQMENGEPVSAADYKEELKPYNYYCIPADTFEETVFPYFDIPLDQFRELTLYDKEKNIYPWIELSASNVSYYPSIIPEVTKVNKHDNGTVTLTVNTLCLDKGTDSLFVHEVTILPLKNGTCKYLSNKIIAQGEVPLPSAVSRFEAEKEHADSKF